MGRRAFSALAAIAVSVTALVGVPAAPVLAAGGFSGVVTDSAGAPIAGARVSATPWAYNFGGSLPNATTALDGSFALPDVPANIGADYRLIVTASGFTPTFVGGSDFFTATPYPVTADENYTDIGVSLLRADAMIEGVVTGPDGVVSGATVRVLAQSLPSGFGIDPSIVQRSVTTDASGAYRIDGLAVASYSVLVDPPPGSALLTTPFGGLDVSSVQTGEGRTDIADVRLVAPGSISGTITDPDGLPVEGATVIASGYPEPIEATSNADGTFLISGLFPGGVGFFAGPPAGSDLLFTYFGNSINGQTASITVVESQTTVGADIQLQAGARFTTVVPGDATASTVLYSCFAPANPVLDPGGAGPSGSFVECGDRPAISVYPGGVVPVGRVTLAAAPLAFPTPPLSAPTTLDVVRGNTYTCTYDLLGTGSFTCAVDGGTPVDTTPPTIACPADASYLLNQRQAMLVAEVADTGSGVTEPTVSVNVATGAIGAASVTVTATDIAGNTSTESCEFTVGVTIERLLSPRADRLTRVRSGSILPLIYRVVDANGRGVDSRAHYQGVTITPVDCPDRRTSYTVALARTGLRRIGGGIWIDGVRTPTLKGCYAVRLDVVGDTATTTIRSV